ncbi:hypothetical protein [Roseicyclus mahoneyensis]|nr:hypothetical protein [Roseicyclus mahoneyensis]
MADIAANRVTIRPVDGPAWQIDGWQPGWAVHPAPDGRAVMLSNPGGNLLAGAAPDLTVLRIMEAPGVLRAVVPLSSLANPTRLQRTASQVVWISGGYHWQDDGWAFTTPDGQNWHLTAEGGLSRR